MSNDVSIVHTSVGIPPVYTGFWMGEVGGGITRLRRSILRFCVLRFYSLFSLMNRVVEGSMT